MNVNLFLLRRLAIAYINDLAGLLAQPWAPAPNYYTWMRHMRDEVQPQDASCVVMETGEWAWEMQHRPYSTSQ
ncbi:uncharacterized protein CDAR_548951 [Caerostris darwini]|uniref:Uncharacterized protein n=1 Tax=Caerostris darwini TaxID=1538125 RepID=A0AAV4WJL9_9ARAC|nr:uncharacterized protein CDAR_548951 [Caerostris darwini]